MPSPSTSSIEPEPQEIQTLLQAAEQQLIEAGLTDSPRLDVELLLCHTLNVSRSYLFTWPDKTLETAQIQKFLPPLAQRLQGYPIAHILGTREFWGLELLVTKDTLIPRPDTETLVEATLSLIQQNRQDHAVDILDLGTGSGAIALALKSEWPNSTITAIDQSPAALAIAQQNANQHQLNIQLQQSDWFSAIQDTQRFDYIVSNPPYIEESDPHLRQGDVRFEPLSALTSGQDGLDDIRLITQQAWQHLKPQGWLLIEHGYHQAEAVAEIFKQARYSEIQLVCDLSGNPRVTIGQREK